MKKSLLALIAALMMTIQVFLPVLAVEIRADGTYSTDSFDLEYTITDGEVTITHIEKTDGLYTACDLTVPEEIDGYPVTTMGEHCFAPVLSDSVKHLYLPSIKTLKEYALSDISHVEEVSIPNVVTIETGGMEYLVNITELHAPNLESISYGGLQRCFMLHTLEAPKLMHIESNSLRYDSSLENIILGDDNQYFSFYEGALMSKDGTFLYAYPSAKGDVVIPDSVEIINRSIFSGYSSIKSVSGKNVRETGIDTFNNSSLESFYFPKLQKIGEDSFGHCDNLKSVKLYQDMEIDKNAFGSCASLERIDIYSIKLADRGMVSNTKSLKAICIYSDCPKSRIAIECNPIIYYPNGAEGYSDTIWDYYTTQASTYTVFRDKEGDIVDMFMTAVDETVVAPEAPHYDHFRFTGWDREYVDHSENINVYAQYEPVYYLNYFVDGEHYYTDEFAEGEQITLIAEPTKEGHTFSGWSAVPETMPATDINCYGTFTINTHIVRFVDWDGTELSVQTVDYGHAAQAPADPVREGYTFVGWNMDFSCVKSDLTITAVYTENKKFIVTFKDWDGTELSVQNVEQGKDAVAPADPVREGYIFTGWSIPFTNVQSDLTVFATYTEKPTALTGDLSGDGVINTADAVFVLKAAAGMIQLDEGQSTAGDCNRDGTVNTADAVLILKYAAGMITSF